MSFVKATLVVDLGNSETRVMTIFNKQRRVSELSNRYAIVDSNYQLPEDYVEDGTSRLLKTKQGVYCTGNVCDREFSMVSIRPTALGKKYDSEITNLILHNAFYEGYQHLKSIAGYTEEDFSGIKWDVTLLIPPLDLAKGGKLLAEKAKLDSIEFLQPKLKVDVHVNKVKVLPEGFCAFVGTVFREGGKIQKGYKPYLEGTVLVMDIGAGTTDFCIIKENHIVDRTKHTLSIGGNNVEQSMNIQILEEFGTPFSPEAVRKAVIEGKIKDGTKFVDVTEHIIKARKEVSQRIANEVRSYFEANQYPLRSIEYALVVGGGSMESQVEGVPSLGETLLGYLRGFAPNIELIDLPQVVVVRTDDNGEEYLSTEKASPRLLNLYGAGILSE